MRLVTTFMVTTNLLVVIKARWFMFNSLRSPGLVTANASSVGECISQCASTSSCSAISYQQASGMCLQSYCNNLDLYKNVGWNSYILAATYVEGVTVLAPQFEWMLTDSCGLSNQGLTNGPKLNLFQVTFSNPSQSANAGNAAQLPGTTTFYVKTDTSTALYNSMGSQSLTVMCWVMWKSALSASPLFEFSIGSTSRGNLFWYLSSSMYYDFIRGTTGFTGAVVTYAFTPVINTWYHMAYVYDGSNGQVSSYLNFVLVNVQSNGFTYNSMIWDTLSLGNSIFDKSTSQFNGLMYCAKILNRTIIAEDISALADSCSKGKLRISV